jgi:hypothetical protein
MKKVHTAIIITVLIFTVSCVINFKTVDLGTYNSINIPEEDLVTLYIEGDCQIERIDNYILVKPTATPAWMTEQNVNRDKKIVKLNPGRHTFFTKFNNGYSYTMYPTPVTAKFEKGNIYLMNYEIKKVKSDLKVTFHIYIYNNGKKGEEVTGIPMENLIEMNLFYSANVKSPLNQGKSVKLENKKFTLIYNPDGYYIQTDKERGVIIKGKYSNKNQDNIFLLMIDTSLEKVYLFDADANIMKKSTSWGTKEHEEVDYKLAHTVLVLIYASEKDVIYQYEKPDELKGTEIAFTISE